MRVVQEKLQSFIMTRVQNGKKDEAQAILDESFAMQNDGKLNAAYLAGMAPRLAKTLKPEFVSDLKGAIANFGGSSAASGVAEKLTSGALGSILGGNKE